MRDVKDAAGQLGERDIAQRHDRFRFAGNAAQAESGCVEAFMRHAVGLQRLLLAVFDDGDAKHLRILERATHQERGGHRTAIVGDRHTSGFPQLGDVRQFLALLAAGDRADRIDAGEIRLSGLLEDVFGDAGVVVHRRGVGHARDGGEPARNRRRGSGRHRLLVLLPWFAQMHVHVDQTGTNDQSGRDFHDRGIGVDRKITADSRDAVIVDQNIEHAIAAVRRVDDPPPLKQPLHLQLRQPAGTARPSARRRR